MPASLSDLLASSPYLRGLDARFPGRLVPALARPDAAFREVIDGLALLAADPSCDETRAGVALREAKAHVALLAAAAETGLPVNPDFNGAKQEGCGYYQTAVEFRPTLRAQADHAERNQQTDRAEIFNRLLDTLPAEPA